MATIHTELPKDVQGHHGEYVVGQILKDFSNPGLELWFDVNYIAGVTDLDLIISDNQVGLYLIEIKSMKIDSIQEFTNSTFVLKTDVTKQHPVPQLRTGSIKLRDHLKRMPGFKDRNKQPFLQTTVLWSEISRKEWKQRFNAPEINGFEAMCLFKDDLNSYNTFTSALQRLWDKPLLGITVPQHARCEHGDMDSFRKAIEPAKHKIEPSISMKTELSRPVKDSQKIAEKYALGKTHLVSLQGPPGTGKTTILREIGLRYLAAGARVLHVTFNKTLAAEQKREYQIMRKNIEEYGFIDVFDTWELYIELGHTGGFMKEAEVLDNVKKYLETDEGKQFLIYDVILIDESQDLTDQFFHVIELIASPTASWFVSYGKGQETTNFRKDGTHPSPWLNTFLAKSDTNVLRRSFRNSTKAFLLAQSLWEKYPELEEAKSWLESKFIQSNVTDNQFELDLVVPQTKNDFKVEGIPDGSTRKLSIKNLILNAIEDSRRANRGEDLLVAVIKPSFKKKPENEETISSSYEIVKEVLDEISQEHSLEFFDFVPDENRRAVPTLGAIRLVTLQGLRGLSASHVIVFDLSQLEKWARIPGNSIKPPIANFTYIALSRSKASTIVAMESSGDSPIETFLLELVSHATKLALKKGDQ